jgi:ketosteroid isomerase-like protein
MSEENLALARAFADAFNRWDVDWILEHVAEEIEFIPLRAATEGAFHGRDGVRRFLSDTEESFDLFQVQNRELESVEDRVVSVGTIRIKGKGSGIETEVPTAAVATIRDGLITRFEDFGDRREAFEAAGLD